MNKVTVFNIM